jgi:uncharacterized phiE125 gp8 family phage protein
MAIRLIAGPGEEPITLDEAKLHLRVDVTAEDTLINGLIIAARQAAEQATGRALMQQTWELALDCFPDEIRLQMPPLQSVSSVKYLDQDGVLQTLATSEYLVNDYKEPARIVLAYGKSWPSTRDQENAVLVRFVAGYADADAVPQEIKQWMLMLIGSMYANRERETVGSAAAVELGFVDRLLDAYRVWGM